MSGLWFRFRRADEGQGYSVADWRGAAAAFACIVLSTVGLVLPPIVGQGSLLAFGIAALLFLAGIVGFVELLKRTSDWQD